MMTSSAVFASSFMIKYTICRSEASLFWNSFEMPKKRDVASFVGNVSPVKRRRAIFVRSIRHLLGDIGEELNSRAKQRAISRSYDILCSLDLAFLKNRSSIDLDNCLIGIFIFLSVAHCCCSGTSTCACNFGVPLTVVRQCPFDWGASNSELKLLITTPQLAQRLPRFVKQIAPTHTRYKSG